MSNCCKLKRILISFLILFTFQSTNLAAANTVVLDNSKSGTSPSGTWKVSGAANYYGSNSLYSGRNGDSYTYNINLAAPGEYRVFARWTTWSNRRTSVPYEISHVGGTSTVKVNQREKGGQWNQLGNTWSFGATAKIKVRSLGNGSTNADAIKIVPVGGNITPVINTIGSQSVSAGSTLRFNVSATDSDGESPVLTASSLPSNAVFIDNNNGSGTFTWSTIPGDRGAYRITFFATDTSDPTITGRRTVSVSVIDSSATTSLTMDNGKAGTSSVGAWKASGAANYYGSNSLYSGRNGDSYTYNTNLAAPGEYRVFARWTTWSNRRTSVPYDISHVGGTTTVKVNQREKGGQWNQLGNTWSFGATAKIKVRSLGNGSTSADAIKLVPVSAGNSLVETPVSAGVIFHHDFDDEVVGAYTDQDLRDKWQVRYGGNVSATKVIKDPTSRSGNALSVLYKANEYGSKHGARWLSDIGSYEELYLSYDVMFENGYDYALGGKLPGLGGGNQSLAGGGSGPPTGVDAWSGRLMWCAALAGLHCADGEVVNYMYIPTNTSAYGKRFQWKLAGQRAIIPGKWHTLEIRYKMNTPGKSNGVLQGWIDGELALDYRSVVYRTVNSLKIDKLVFSTFHGGNSPLWAPSRNQHIFFDNFVLSTNPITH